MIKTFGLIGQSQRQLIKVIAQNNLRITNIQTKMVDLKKELNTLVVSREHNKTELDVLNFRIRKQNSDTSGSDYGNYHYNFDYERPHEVPPHSNS